MKDERLIYIMRNIDDDLICEAMKRRTADTETEAEEIRAVYVTGRKKGQTWKNAAAAVIMLAVAGGAIFVVSSNGGIQGQLPAATDETGGQTKTTDARTEEKTDAVVSSEPAREVKEVVPLKVISLNGWENFDAYQSVHYVDSYPYIPQMENMQEYFTEMTTEELIEYYNCFSDDMYKYYNDSSDGTGENLGLPGLDDIKEYPYDNALKHWLDTNQVVEVIDENTCHGIYNLPDGSVYDINTFTFELTEASNVSANRFTVTIGKKTKFGKEYFDYYGKVRDDGIPKAGGRRFFYNEDKDMFFALTDYLGVIYMFSGTTDEITKSFFAGDPEEAEYGYYTPIDNNKALICADMLSTIKLNFFSVAWNPYIDKNTGLWYVREINCCFNEDTYEWFPAKELNPD